MKKPYNFSDLMNWIRQSWEKMKTNTDQSQNSSESIKEKLDTWVCSGDGEKLLRQATQDAHKCTENLQQMRQLDSDKLNEPFTI